MVMTDNPRTNEFGRSFYAEYGPPHVYRQPMAWVELKDLGTKWYPELRKSYKSLINWGSRNLKIQIIEKDNFSFEECEKFRLFHAMVAGRITRSKMTWHLQYQEVKDGRGEIILGYLSDALVTGSLFIDGGTICNYWTGVYHRDHFDKPLAHYPVWLGIQRARQRGMKWVELGEAHEWGEGVTAKELSISQFKRGFATHIAPYEISPLSSDIEHYRKRP